MPPRARRSAFRLLAVMLGAIIGYLLFNPLITFPVEAVVAGLEPVLQFASVKFKTYVAEDIFQVVVVVFVMNLPNTVLAGAVTALSMSWLQRRREILYASLLWPLFLHLIYWLEVGLLKLGAMRIGMPTDAERLPASLEFKYTSVLVLITVGVFLFVALLLGRLFRKRQRCPTLNSGAPKSSAPAS